MNEKNKIIELLGELGIPEKEAKAYSKLIVRGPSTAIEVADLSGIERPRVYDILNKLENKGLIYVQEGQPTLYLPISPKRVYELSKKKQGIEGRKRIQATKELSRVIDPIYMKGVLPKDLSYMIRGPQNIKKTFLKAAENARRVSIISTHDIEKEISDRNGELKFKGKLRLIAKEQSRDLRGSEFKKYAQPLELGIAIIDERECMLLSEKNGKYERCLHIKNSLISTGFEQLFDLIWKSI